jgi:hypothetical protein
MNRKIYGARLCRRPAAAAQLVDRNGNTEAPAHLCVLRLVYDTAALRYLELIATRVAILAIVTHCVLVSELFAAEPESGKIVFQNDFQKAPVGAPPEEFMVLEGNFEVKQEGENKFLELPGAPLDTFGLLFGPPVKDSATVSARIYGTSKGRRAPTFGVGLGGAVGYRFQVSASKKQVELIKGDAVTKSVPFEWKTGIWTDFKLSIEHQKATGLWQVKGTLWQEGAAAQTVVLTLDEKQEPSAGKASIWGSPFSGTAIRFDDLAVKQ